MAKNTKVAQQTQISILDSFWMEEALMLVNASRLCSLMAGTTLPWK